MKYSTPGDLGKVTIGIVLKKRKPEEDANSFDSEMAWFSQLVCRKKTSVKLSNILLVADASELEGTGVTKRGKHYSVIDARRFPDITEAIRLDLNTRELRWNFFGFHEKTEMGEKLRSIIEKCFARVM
jgi:predicted DNA binding protein